MTDSERDSKICAMDARLEEINKTLWRLVEAVYGNGQPGIKTEVQTLTEKMDRHVSDHDKRRIDWQWIITTIIAVGAILSAWFKA